MKPLAVTVTEANGVKTSLAAPDVVTALAVAEINAGDGEVEISNDQKPLARLRKGTKGEAGFWEVNP